jgi:hypothetical protein
MGRNFRLRFGFPVVFIGVLVISALGLAIAGNNPISGSRAGQGTASVIEGYRVENLFLESALNEEMTDSVAIIASAKFDIYTDPGVRPVMAETDKVFIQYRGGGRRSDWKECIIVDVGKVECDTADLNFEFKKITNTAINAFAKADLENPLTPSTTTTLMPPTTTTPDGIDPPE